MGGNRKEETQHKLEKQRNRENSGNNEKTEKTENMQWIPLAHLKENTSHCASISPKQRSKPIRRKATRH